MYSPISLIDVRAFVQIISAVVCSLISIRVNFLLFFYKLGNLDEA